MWRPSPCRHDVLRRETDLRAPPLHTAPLTTLHLFRIPPRGVPRALARMALDRRRLRSTPGLAFWKLLGTGDGRTFDLRDADLRTWGLLAVWAADAAADRFERCSPVAAGWAGLAQERWRVTLRPVSAHGSWSGRQPFGSLAPAGAPGPVAAITRARLRLRRAPGFWRAVPPVTADLARHPGLLLSVGIGEAPVGLQGTFSLWSDSAALRRFAYRGEAHRSVIRRTTTEGWYAEELFARFAVLGSSGTIFGGDPLAGVAQAPPSSGWGQPTP